MITKHRQANLHLVDDQYSDYVKVLKKHWTTGLVTYSQDLSEFLWWLEGCHKSEIVIILLDAFLSDTSSIDDSVTALEAAILHGHKNICLFTNSGLKSVHDAFLSRGVNCIIRKRMLFSDPYGMIKKLS